MESKLGLELASITWLKCRWCGDELTRLIWNKKGDILACSNSGCELFRQPQGFIKEDRWNMKQVLALQNKEVMGRIKNG